jgi:hypothetical protein
MLISHIYKRRHKIKNPALFKREIFDFRKPPSYAGGSV